MSLANSRGKTLGLVGTVVLGSLWSCHIDPYARHLGGLDGGVFDGGRDGGGDGGATTCVPTGLEEICNEVDDDCDGVVDNGFDLQNDPNNCGRCGNLCAAPNASVVCLEGACVLESCQPGFADVDPDESGCEYRCPVFPIQPEECNGVDEDCDGEVDEPTDLATPPQGLCRNQAGTPCAGVTMICATRGDPAVTTWYCDYPVEVEFDPLVPNGIALEETLCDGLDGDCDGAKDEIFTDLGQECDNGGVGACRDVGQRSCDPDDATATFCDLTLLPDPDPSAPRDEECNGADDNCDGIVDNYDPTDPARVIDDMVRVEHSGLDFWIYRYEASRPDATESDVGGSSARPCSRPAVLPWANVTYDEAAQACASVGKSLCSAAEWQAACAGPLATRYPYGASFEEASCNGASSDGREEEQLVPTGEMADCVSVDGAYDLSGNLREWTDHQTGVSPSGDPVYVVRGGEFHTPAPGLACDFTLSHGVSTVVLPTIGFRCCSSTGP